LIKRASAASRETSSSLQSSFPSLPPAAPSAYGQVPHPDEAPPPALTPQPAGIATINAQPKQTKLPRFQCIMTRSPGALFPGAPVYHRLGGWNRQSHFGRVLDAGVRVLFERIVLRG
jgi:hypothetical protein